MWFPVEFVWVAVVWKNCDVFFSRSRILWNEAYWLVKRVRSTDLAECYKLHKMWKYRQTKENINKLFTKHTRPVLGKYCPVKTSGNIFLIRTSSFANITFIIRLNLFSGHGARWLVAAERSGKSLLPSQHCERAINFFLDL